MTLVLQKDDDFHAARPGDPPWRRGMALIPSLSYENAKGSPATAAWRGTAPPSPSSIYMERAISSLEKALFSLYREGRDTFRWLGRGNGARRQTSRSLRRHLRALCGCLTHASSLGGGHPPWGPPLYIDIRPGIGADGLIAPFPARRPHHQRRLSMRVIRLSDCSTVA